MIKSPNMAMRSTKIHYLKWKYLVVFGMNNVQTILEWQRWSFHIPIINEGNI